jgi:hypothetical protein
MHFDAQQAIVASLMQVGIAHRQLTNVRRLMVKATTTQNAFHQAVGVSYLSKFITIMMNLDDIEKTWDHGLQTQQNNLTVS